MEPLIDTLIRSDEEMVMARARVELGAAFLDQHPEVAGDWRSMIDRETFRIWDGNRCVLAQVMGVFFTVARDRLWPDTDHEDQQHQARVHGFDWGTADDGVWLDPDPLDRAWREYLWPTS